MTIFSIPVTAAAPLSPLLKPQLAESMDGYRVSQAVNSPVNNTPECIGPDTPRLTASIPRRLTPLGGALPRKEFAIHESEEIVHLL